MARNQSKGRLQDRIDRENARGESRHAAPKAPGGGSLPSGIDNGIAKLTRVDFDTIENGKYAGSQRFYCHGVCILPKTHDNIRCEGRLVQPGMITLDDVKSDYGDTSFAENVAKAENRLKLLGFPTEDFEDLESDTLNYFQTGDTMYFEFRTWSPQDSDRVLIQIMGPAESPGEEEDDVKEAPTQAAQSAVAEEPPKAEPEPEPKVEASLEEIAKDADGGDETAQLKIVSAAEALNIDPEDERFSDWSDVVKAIKAASTVESNGAVKPTAGDVFSFKPPRARSTKDCEVVSVDEDAKTVSLKSLEDEREYNDVSWDKLVEIS